MEREGVTDEMQDKLVINLDEDDAVSYTHLDVYKRQEFS